MLCDKCGTEVPEENDASIVDSYFANSPFLLLFIGPRHFLPVKDKNGNVICEGSPSRAQYIEGQPRDTRGYSYIEENEQKWRDAYEKTKEFARSKNG